MTSDPMARTVPRPSVRERATGWLAAAAPAAVWRTVGAFACTLLTVLVTTGGLILPVREVQTALVGGVCAALIAPTRRSSAVVAAAATALGMVIGPANGWESTRSMGARILAAGASALLAALVALVAAIEVRRAPRSGRWLTWAVIGLLVANVWFSTIDDARSSLKGGDGRDMPSLFQVLEGSATLAPGVEGGADRYVFLRVLTAVERGEPFYRSWHDEFGPKRALGGSAGGSVVNYNLPTRFLLWAALPGSNVSIVYAYLVLASLAVAAVPFAVRGSVRLPLAIPGAAAVAAYLYAFGYWLSVMPGEPWAGALSLLSVAAWARSTWSRRWRVWTVAAVALGVLSALFREPAVLVPVAGLVSAMLVRDGQRRFRAAAWAAGLATFGGLYLVHYLNARPFLSGPAGGAVFRITGPETIVSALTYGTPALGTSSVLPLVLACSGILGILLSRNQRVLTFAGLFVAFSFIAYLFVGNAAENRVTGTVVNYWGAVVVPVIYACVPLAFAVIPSLAPARVPAPPPSQAGDATSGDRAPAGARGSGRGGGS